MRFKTKDLLVSVTPKAEVSEADLAKVCALHTYICFSPTYCFHQTCHFHTWRPCRFHSIACLPCSFQFSQCPPCSAFASVLECPGITAECAAGSRITVFDPTIFIQDRQDIATVRQQLRETLTKLDEVEKGGLPGDIQTRAEAEALEASLKEALEQVQAAKKNLKK
jgi:hypothetical protein